MKQPVSAKKLSLLAFVCCTLSLPALADEQAERIRLLEQRLRESLVMIESLSARVAELERAARPAAAAAKPAATPAEGEQARAVATLQEDVDQISRGLSQRVDHQGAVLHGFSDVGAAWSSAGDPARLRGFNVGTLDLYMTPQFGDRVKSLIELAFEYTLDEGLEVDLERLQIGYTVSNALTLWVGRFHTPFGWWNTAYHHGANLQTSISRPRYVEFEDKGGILPVHSVGLWASGKTALGPGRIVYEGYLGNGPRIDHRQLNFNAANDDNAGKMLGGSLAYEPGGALSGLTLGVHAFGVAVNSYADDGTVLQKSRLRMAGGFFGYDDRDWEAIGEYYRFSNSDMGLSAKRSSRMWSLQAGMTMGLLTPFVRYESSSLDPADYYFASQREGRSYRRVAAGARYELDPRSSLKFELSHTAEAAALQYDEKGALSPFAGARYRRAAFQYSIAF